MKASVICAVIAVASMILLVSGCKPTVDSSPGHACFVLYAIGEDGVKAENVTTVKVNKDVGADITCAGHCNHNYFVDWGDRSKGDQLTHVYNDAGTYTVTYECGTMSSKAQRYAKKRKHRDRGHRYQSSKVITVTP